MTKSDYSNDSNEVCAIVAQRRKSEILAQISRIAGSFFALVFLGGIIAILRDPAAHVFAKTFLLFILTCILFWNAKLQDERVESLGNKHYEMTKDTPL